MIPPSQIRPTAYKGGIIQIFVTRACNQACFGCTSGSNLAGKPTIMSLEHFEQAVVSLKDYFGVLGVFGGLPTLHPHFSELCAILRKHRPKSHCGLWANDLKGHGAVARETFDPAVSNLNVHLDKESYKEFAKDWPEAMPFGKDVDSRHATPYVSMMDLGIPEEKRLELIGNCSINKFWSAMICTFRNQLRGFFCEIAASQSMLRQWETSGEKDDYVVPDTGIKIAGQLNLPDTMPIIHGCRIDCDWWKLPMQAFEAQVDYHCHRCAIPLNGYGELAIGGEVEYLSETYKDFRPKVKGRTVQIVTKLEELKPQGIEVTKYLGK